MTRIVVDPPEVRRAATRIRDAAGDFEVLRSRIRGHAMPELPPALAASVPAELSALASRVDVYAGLLPEDAKELEVRAFWAEVADELSGGSSLTDAQLAQLLAYARDGSLIDYATPEQRALAGGFFGEHYRDTFKEPSELIELADILRANGSDQDFAAEFVETFGAENFADVPRVIQAMDWSESLMMMGGSGSDSFFDSELALGAWDGRVRARPRPGRAARRLLARARDRDLERPALADGRARPRLRRGSLGGRAAPARRPPLRRHVPARHVPLGRDRGARARERDPVRRAGHELRARSAAATAKGR